MSLDEERRTLERQAKNDPQALERLQAMNDRVGLSADDADYLLAYLSICERFGRGDIEEESAYGELRELNVAFKPKITSTAVRTVGHIQFVNEAFRRGRQDGLESWSSSNNC